MSDKDVIDVDDFDDIDPVDIPEDLELEADSEEVVEENKEIEPTKDKSVSNDLDINLDFLDSIPGVVTGDLGLEVSRFPVERARFVTAKKDLISVVLSKVVAIKTHYSEELGSYLCFGGRCCEVDGLPRIKYLLPILTYDTNKAGKPVSKDIDYKVLAIGKDSYEDIMTIADLNGGITNIDLLVTCKDEQYQKLSFAVAGESRWKKSKALVSQTVTFWKEHIKDIILPVARTMTEKDYLSKTEVDSGPGDADVSFNDVFD